MERAADRENKGNAPGDDVNPNKPQLELPTRASMMKSVRIGRLRINTGNQETVFQPGVDLISQSKGLEGQKETKLQ